MSTCKRRIIKKGKKNINWKDFINKNRRLILIIVVVIIVVLNIYLFLKGIWSAVLSSDNVHIYFASLIQAAATISAIWLTINYNKKLQKDERHLAIKPFLYSEIEQFKEWTSETKECQIIVFSLTKQTKEMIEKVLKSFKESYSSAERTTSKIKITTFEKEYHVIKCLLWNYGAGNALRVRFENSVYPANYFFVLPKSEVRKFIIIFPHKEKIELRLSYTDVESISKYSYKETIKFLDAENNTLEIVSEHALNYPE